VWQYAVSVEGDFNRKKQKRLHKRRRPFRRITSTCRQIGAFGSSWALRAKHKMDGIKCWVVFVCVLVLQQGFVIRSGK
jgi:hypothetical protein